jgi:hypothetical protein
LVAVKVATRGHLPGRWGKLEVRSSVDEATLQRFLDVLERRRVGIDVRRIFVLCSPLKMTIMAEVFGGFVKGINPEKRPRYSQ